MKLLLDQHISYKLVDRLAESFPGSSHVRLLRLENSSDSDVWYYARTHDFVVVTKDSDLVDLAILRGAPPKVVWLRIGNTSADRVEDVLKGHQLALEYLVRDVSRAILEIVS